MVAARVLVLAAMAWQAATTSAQKSEGLKVENVAGIVEQLEDPSQAQSTSLKIEASTSFPQSEVFGVKLVNGRATEARVEIKNNEPEPVTLLIIGGSLTTPPGLPGAPDPPAIVRNLTTSRYGLKIEAGQSQSFEYFFQSELHPQDLQLNLAAMLQNEKQAIFQHNVFNGTVSVVEAPFSILDPQVLFLYLFLAGVFGGVGFFVYQTWVTRLFPQKRRGGKGGERAKKSSGQSKKVDPADQISVVGADGPAVTSGAKAYDESWIPAEHLKRPEARRVGSGKPRSKAN